MRRSAGSTPFNPAIQRGRASELASRRRRIRTDAHFSPAITHGRALAACDARSAWRVVRIKRQVQTSFGDAGDITRSYGAGDFSQDRQRVEDALMARMNPQLARERGNIEQRLGRPGHPLRLARPMPAAMDDYNRQATDARFAAIGQAGNEQQRMMDMAAQRAGFQNAAQQQGYDQAHGPRHVSPTRRRRSSSSRTPQLAGFYNAGLAQQLAQAQSGFNAQNAARNQYMQEQYAQRNQPLNEISCADERLAGAAAELAELADVADRRPPISRGS